MKVLHINGNDLTLDDVRAVVFERRPVMLAPEARLAVDRARAVVEDLVENNRVGYAVTTGVGQLSDVRIPPDDIRQLQVNLMRSHAVGVGEPLSEEVSRAMILLRANSLAKGCSGVRGTRHRHALRDVESRRASRDSVARQRGRERRSGAAVAPRTGADRRGRSVSSTANA